MIDFMNVMEVTYMSRRYIECAYCGKPIYEGDSCLEHEYGRKFCSYKCLVIEGFYGHYKLYDLQENRLGDEVFLTQE